MTDSSFFFKERKYALRNFEICNGKISARGFTTLYLKGVCLRWPRLKNCNSNKNQTFIVVGVGCSMGWSSVGVGLAAAFDDSFQINLHHGSWRRPFPFPR